MNQLPIEKARDSDLRLSRQALRRAAHRAHELAVQTGTSIVVSRDGVIEHIAPTTTGMPLQVQEGPATYGDKE